MQLCECLGLPACAREFATAALHSVDRAFPDGQRPSEHDITMGSATSDDDGDDVIIEADDIGHAETLASKRQKRKGRLWGNLFAYALEDCKFEVRAWHFRSQLV